jgi:hypothetical protein
LEVAVLVQQHLMPLRQAGVIRQLLAHPFQKIHLALELTH